MLRRLNHYIAFGVLVCAGCVSPKAKTSSNSQTSAAFYAPDDALTEPENALDTRSFPDAKAPSIQVVSLVENALSEKGPSEGIEAINGDGSQGEIVRASLEGNAEALDRSRSDVQAVFEGTVLKPVPVHSVPDNEVPRPASESSGNALAAYFAGIPEADQLDLGAFSVAGSDAASGLPAGPLAAMGDDLATRFPGIEEIDAGDATRNRIPADGIPADGIQVNLPTVMAMVDSQHPAVGIAQWRVQQAYAQLTQARALWLPSIRGGLSLHRHDGNYQASNGDIVDVNRSSLQYGLGAGATGAGTTAALPGVVAQFHLADAIFQPSIAQSRAHAQGHAARAVINRQMLESGLAYLELLAAYQDMEIIKASQVRIEQLAELTKSFADAGEGLQADADRLQTEWLMIQSRRVAAGERIAVAESRLALSVSGGRETRWIPMDMTVVPWEMVGAEVEAGDLVAIGLRARPELRESQSLVSAACDAYDRERYAPFVPSVLLGFSTGGFGGGLGGRIDDVDGRYDFDAMIGWEIRNLGFGERAARREASARIQQAKFEKLRVLDTIANEIAESAAQVKSRRQQIEMNRQAIEVAESSVRRNLDRIREGEGLPIEALQAVQAIELASQAYLQAVARYNEAQLRLQFALGWPDVPVEPVAVEIE